MAREMNPNLYPPDGYVFRERDGSIHRGDSWRDLTRIVTEYRTRNKMEVGEVRAEIMTQHCAKVPGHCRDEVAFVPPPADGLSFNKKVLGWVAWALGRKRLNAWDLVEESEVDRRAAICAVCPMQKSLNHSCEACLTTLKSGRKALLDGKMPKYLNLQPCGVLNEDCATSVHAILEPKQGPNLPEACWRRG